MVGSFGPPLIKGNDRIGIKKKRPVFIMDVCSNINMHE
jgi:hypothetical protein